MEKNFFLYKNCILNDFKEKDNYQKVDEYYKKRNKECEKNLSKFC